jgi:hypothetical protein
MRIEPGVGAVQLELVIVVIALENAMECIEIAGAQTVILGPRVPLETILKKGQAER